MAKSEVHHILVLGSLIHVARFDDNGDLDVRRYYEFSEATRKRCERLKNCYEHDLMGAGFTIEKERRQTDRFAQIGVE